MSKYLVDSADMTAIADAIRSKTGDSNPMTVADMPTEIDSISTGGTDYMAQRVQGTLTSYNIPNTCTQISDGAFAGATYLQSVTVPSTVTSIGIQAFDRCVSLTSINIPNSVTSIGTSAFSGCRDLPSIEIPNSVTSIGNDAFLACNSLTSITIPSSVINLGQRVFDSCDSLTSITIPGTRIPYAYCNDCENLQTVNFTSLVNYFEYVCFDNTSLRGHIFVGSTCTFSTRCFYLKNNPSIPDYLYIHLTATNNIATSYSMTNDCFNTTYCRLVVPAGYLSAYQSAYPTYASIMIEESN